MYDDGGDRLGIVLMAAGGGAAIAGAIPFVKRSGNDSVHSRSEETGGNEERAKNLGQKN
jgi:hypothetical protein